MDQSRVNELVKGIIAKNAKAEKELYNSFKDQVTFFVRLKIGNNNPDWQDVLQDIFISFFQRIRNGDYKNSKGTIGAFLQNTMKFKILDYLKSPINKKRSQFTNLDNVTLDNPAADPEEHVIKEQRKEALKKAIISLKEPYKQILYLIIYNQFGINEVAKKLGLSEQKVSNLKSYATSMIKRKLEKNKEF